MKNYKFLVPIVLVAFFGLSIYMLYSGRLKDEQEYQNKLNEARAYRNQEIYVDAEASYLEALNMRESLALHIELAQLYLEMGDDREARKIAEELIEDYREEAAAYEFIVDIYMSDLNYTDVFVTYDVMNDLHVSSKKIDSIVKSLEHEYFLRRSRYTQISTFSEGLCEVKGESTWGFATTGGNLAISMQFAEVGPFCEGLAPVVDYAGGTYYVDTSGNKKKIIPNIENVVKLGLLHGGILSAYNGKTWAFYKEDGTKLTEDYVDATYMINGYAAIKKDGDWYIIDSTGTPIFEQAFDEVVRDERQFICRNGVFFVKIDGEYFMLDESGEKVTDTAYEDVDMFMGDDLAAVKLNGKWGFINNTGEFVIEPTYDKAKSFSNGYAAVEVDGKWGFINSNQEMHIEPQFEDGAYFTDSGSVFVKDEGTWKMLCFYKYNH